MNRAALLMCAVMAAALAGPAQAYVTVVGGAAAACYEFALEERYDVEGVHVCTTALAAEPMPARDRAATYVNRGILRLNIGEQDGAMADFDRAISTYPDLAEGHINRGTALLRRQDYRAAIDALTAGLALGPENPAQAYYNRGVANEELGNIRAAYDDYRVASEIDPDWNAPRLELARFQVRR